MALFKNILTVVLGAGIFALHPGLNKGETPITYLQYLVYGNDVKINYNAPINKNDITIKWACEDKSTPCSELMIYENGGKVNDIPFERGNQRLEVFYKKKLVGTLHQNKLVKTQSHKYNLVLTANENSLFFKGEAIGPSPATSVVQNEV